MDHPVHAALQALSAAGQVADDQDGALAALAHAEEAALHQTGAAQSTALILQLATDGLTPFLVPTAPPAVQRKALDVFERVVKRHSFDEALLSTFARLVVARLALLTAPAEVTVTGVAPESEKLGSKITLSASFLLRWLLRLHADGSAAGEELLEEAWPVVVEKLRDVTPAVFRSSPALAKLAETVVLCGSGGDRENARADALEHYRQQREAGETNFGDSPDIVSLESLHANDRGRLQQLAEQCFGHLCNALHDSTDARRANLYLVALSAVASRRPARAAAAARAVIAKARQGNVGQLPASTRAMLDSAMIKLLKLPAVHVAGAGEGASAADAIRGMFEARSAAAAAAQQQRTADQFRRANTAFDVGHAGVARILRARDQAADYPPAPNTVTVEELRQLTFDQRVTLLIANMEHLPPPPEGAPPRPETSGTPLDELLRELVGAIETADAAKLKAARRGRRKRGAAAMDPRRSADPRRAAKQARQAAAQPEPMPPQECSHFAHGAFRRMLCARGGALKGRPGQHMKEGLLARVAALWADERDPAVSRELPQMWGDVLEHVAEDVPGRYAALVSLAYQARHDVVVAQLDGQTGRELQDKEEQYTALVRRTLQLLVSKLAPKDKLFTRVVLELPQLTDAVFAYLGDWCADPASGRATTALATLRDLVNRRPPERERALGMLLQAAAHADAAVRDPAQRLITNQLYHPPAMPAVCDAVEAFAFADAAPGEAQLALLLALCTKKPALVKRLLAVYTTAVAAAEEAAAEVAVVGAGSGSGEEEKKEEEQTEEQAQRLQQAKDRQAKAKKTQKFLHDSLDPLLRFLAHKTSAPRVLQLFTGFPAAAAPLVLQVTHALTPENRNLSKALVNTVKQLQAEAPDDRRFSVPILGVLEQPDVLAELPRLLRSLTTKQLSMAFRRVLTARPPPLTAEELLVALHSFDDEPELALEQVIPAVDLCLQSGKLFNRGVLGRTLARLERRERLPRLFMRTLIKAVVQFPRLVEPVIEMLGRQLQRAVWTDADAWQGFKLALQKIGAQPACRVLAHMPAAQLREVLTEHQAELLEPMLQFAQMYPNYVAQETGVVLGELWQKAAVAAAAAAAASAEAEENAGDGGASGSGGASGAASGDGAATAMEE